MCEPTIPPTMAPTVPSTKAQPAISPSDMEVSPVEKSIPPKPIVMTPAYRNIWHPNIVYPITLLGFELIFEPSLAKPWQPFTPKHQFQRIASPVNLDRHRGMFSYYITSSEEQWQSTVLAFPTLGILWNPLKGKDARAGEPKRHSHPRESISLHTLTRSPLMDARSVTCMSRRH